MGIGQALHRGTTYDDNGLQRNPALLEYKLQTGADCAPIDIHFVQINTPGPPGRAGPRASPRRPNVATAAAISNALAQLVGATLRQLPMTAERVWTTLQDSSSRGDRA